jgi:uncharacterized protein (TIGR02594 family)
MPTDLQSTAGLAAPWLIPALAELGQHEQTGTTDNPRIVNFYRLVGHPEIQHDEVAWCAAFVGAMLETAGLSSTRSLMARSYLTWGTALTTGRRGAIAVFRRGGDPSAGHVGFWLGESDDRIHLLGGNQGDAVSISTMAKVDLICMRWPTANPPSAPLAPTSLPETFEQALVHVLRMEGGWTDDPYDPGGPTNFGITLATLATHTKTAVTALTFPGLKADLRTISPATVRTIYFERYWQPCRAQLLPPALALMHFDAAVNHGVGGAARLLQRALRVEADGEIGPQTFAAAAAQPLSNSLENYAVQRRALYRRLGHFWRFGRGWLARVDATLAAAETLISTATTSHNGERPMPDTTTTPATTPAPRAPTLPRTADVPSAKWWGHSTTIWGTLITALSTVLPLLGPALGLDLKPEIIRQLGDNLVVVAQAVTGLAGTIMALYGRAVATTLLERRNVTVQI